MGYETQTSPVALSARPRIRALQASVRSVAIVLILLMLMGAAMVYSTTVYSNIAAGEAPYGDFIRHMMMMGIGVVLSLVGISAFVAFSPIRRWARFVIPVFFLVSLALVALVSLTDLGVSANGATRSIEVMGITFQSSELLKLFLILYLAQLLCWWRRQPEEILKAQEQGRVLSSRRPSWPHAPLLAFLAIGAAAGFTVIQPDLGSTAIIVAASVITLFIAGISRMQKIAILATLVVLGLSVFYVAPYFVPYVSQRLETFRNPMENENAASFQITQSMGAIIDGGTAGRGYLRSEQKLNRLPFARTDFVFPIIIEELGLLGGIFVMGLFVALAWFSSELAGRCREPFHRTVAAAIGFTICLQAMVNIAVTTNVVPNSGLTLPFFSVGGTSLVVSMVSVSLIIAIGLAEVRSLSRESMLVASGERRQQLRRERSGTV
ncbi:FtsW/RodA/SpoVE family cell cycle protein [bacterium]|nr:FtsW/RodA/SpoVE family cell cycle protein [bacterium]